MVLSCFLVYFLVFAFQASGMVYDNAGEKATIEEAAVPDNSVSSSKQHGNAVLPGLYD